MVYEISYQKFNTAGHKLMSRDRNAGTTQMEYNKIGNLTKTITPKGEEIVYEYHPKFQKLQTIKRPGNEGNISFTYNENGRPETVTIQEYNKALGVMNDAYKETFQYNEYGMLTYSKKEIDDLRLIFQYTYDNLRRPETVTYPNGITVRNHYSQSGHLFRVSMEQGDDKNNEVVRYGLLPDGRLQRLTGNNVDTYVKYNPINDKPLEVVTKLDAAHIVQRWGYRYDAADNIRKITDLINSKNTQEFTYDNLNRMTSATGVYGEDGKLKTVDYVYNPNGTLKTKGNIEMVYGDASHPNAVTEIRVETEANTFYDQVYKYDNRGNMTQRGDDIFVYNSMGQMVEYQKSMDDVTKYLYDYTGQRIKKLRDKTGEIVYRFGEYEVNRRPGKTDKHTIYVKGASGDLVAQYTQDGAVLVTDDTLNEDATFLNFLNTQRIDFLKFLVRTQSDYPYAVRLFALSIVFALILAYFIPMYFYNLKQKEEEFYTGLNNPFIQNNRVLSFISPFILLSVVFVFGTACVPEGLKGQDKEPFWLMGAFTTPPNGGGDPSSISDPGQPGRPSPGVPEVGMYFFHPNHLGSITMITDAHGKIAAIGDTGATKVNYKPFGEINRANSAGADIFRHKYTGQEEDSETGFYYYKSRYYDPFIGKFTQADSIVSAESLMGMDQYAYAEGNPIKFTDPRGRSKQEMYIDRAKKDLEKAVMIEIGSQSDIHFAAVGYYNYQNQRDAERTMDRKLYQKAIEGIVLILVYVALWATEALTFGASTPATTPAKAAVQTAIITELPF